jgi:uncharacterized protein (TIRG00374 family)
VTKPLPAWKKGLGISLALSITAALFVFFRNFNEDTLENLLKVRVEYLLIAIIMVFILWIIEGLRIRLLVSTFSNQKNISLFEAMQIYLLTFFFASVTPLAAGEWPAHIYALSRHGLSLGESSAVTVTRSFLTRFLFTVTAISFLIIFRSRLVPTFLNRVFIYAVFVSVFTLLGLLFILWKPMSLSWVLQKIGSFAWGKYIFSRNPKWQKIYPFLGQELRDFLYSTRSLNRFKIGNLIIISLLSVAFWLCFFSIAPVILLGLNKPAPYLQSLVWQVVIQMIIVYIPIPGGSGVAELSLASLFAYFVPPSVLGIFVMVWRFFTYYVLLFFGGLIALGKAL